MSIFSPLSRSVENLKQWGLSPDEAAYQVRFNNLQQIEALGILTSGGLQLLETMEEHPLFVSGNKNYKQLWRN